MNSLSKGSFRLLLAIYLAVFWSIFPVATATAPWIPETIRQAADQSVEHAWLAYGGQTGRALGYLMVASLIGNFLGIIGMFFLWRWSAYLFVTAFLVRMVSGPLLSSWSVRTTWDAFFSDTEIFLCGVIITLVFFGPAKQLFQRRNRDSSLPG